MTQIPCRNQKVNINQLLCWFIQCTHFIDSAMGIGQPQTHSIDDDVTAADSDKSLITTACCCDVTMMICCVSLPWQSVAYSRSVPSSHL